MKTNPTPAALAKENETLQQKLKAIAANANHSAYIAESVDEGFEDVVAELKRIRIALIKGFIGLVCVIAVCAAVVAVGGA